MLTITNMVDKYTDRNYDPIANPVMIYPGKKIKKTTRVSLKTNIKRNIKVLKKRKYSKYNMERLVNALYVGQKHYKIHYKDVLAMLKIESDFRIVIKSVKNRDGTYDIGISQQNSPYYKKRYKTATKILKKYKIKHSKGKYDLYLSVLSCYGELNWIKKALCDSRKYSYKRWICSYNTGVAGYTYKINAREKYWKKFSKSRFKLSKGYL